MKRLGKFAAFALLAMLAVVFTFGCADAMKVMQASHDSAQIVVDQGKTETSDLQKQADALPPGPEKDKIVAQLAKVKDVVDKAAAYVTQSQGYIDTLKNGQVPDELKGVLSTTPYGAYVLLGLSVLGNAVAGGKVAQWKDAATKIIASWQAVGAPLSGEEKAAVAEIQGDKVTELVHAVKAALPDTEPFVSKPAA